MLNFVFVSIAFAVIGYSMLLSVLRKLSKSRIHGILKLASAAAAIITTVSMKATLASDATMKAMEDAFAGANLSMVTDFMQASADLTSLLLNCMAALIAPVVCLVLYFVFSAIANVIYFIVTLVIRRILKKQDRAADDQQKVQRLERSVDKIRKHRMRIHLPDRQHQHDRHDQ